MFANIVRELITEYALVMLTHLDMPSLDLKIFE